MSTFLNIKLPENLALFSGAYIDDPITWKKRMTAFVALIRPSEDSTETKIQNIADKMYALSLGLTGAALSWFNSLSEEKRMNLDDFWQSFEEKWVGTYRQQTLFLRLQERKQEKDESVTEYAHSLKELYVQTDSKAAEGEKILKFLFGLRYNLKKHLLHRKFDSLDAAIQEAELRESVRRIYKSMNGRKRGNASEDRNSDETFRVKDDINKKTGDRDGEQSSVSEMKRIGEEIRSELRRVRQAIDGIDGKFENRRENAVKKRKLYCYQCGRPGHVQQQCRTVLQEEK